ncbi:MAG TPA: adenylate/guanylate cyclase domain-containing protein [Microvirga sp.]|nr:adenylate/guanylate cyclase domain-containing protein [Microvirga sp.]
MQCPSCSFEAPPDFSFCPKCGQELGRVCPSCRFCCPPDYAFCPQCGTKLAVRPKVASADLARSAAPPRTLRWAADAEADRRLVTAVFADLCNFTALTERLDPERVLALQRDLFRELTGAVEVYGGFVDKVMGDGLLALFGAPVAREDDPERALQCALALSARTKEVAARWSDLAGPLALHIGVNTGPVVAGAVGSGNYSVAGDTVNAASRLQALAGPGEVLVGPVTHRLTRHAFAFEPLGPLVLRGRSEALDVYRLTGALESPRPARGLQAIDLSAPLLGRNEELGRLTAAFDSVRGGQTQVVRLVGEAGIGKTRLLGAFIDDLRARGLLDGVVLRTVTATPLERRSYGVIAAILRHGYEIAPSDPLETARDRLASGLRGLGLPDEEIARIAPVVLRVLGLAAEEEGSGPLEPEQVRRHIVLAVRTMLERRLAHGPVMLVIEDLHWADAASVELVRVLADSLPESPLMLLVTHRPDFDASALATHTAAQTALRLAPLPSSEARALFDALFGASSTRLPDDLRGLAVERAGGNPLYLEEIVRTLVEDGVLVRDADGWRATRDTVSVAVPLTLHGLLLARLDRLPESTRRTVQEASVLGAVFEAGLLARIAPEPDALDNALDALVDAEFLEELPRTGSEAGARRFRFRHTLLRDVVYENMLLSRRTALHRRVGEILEGMTAGAQRRPEHLVALARHFELGGQPARAARFLTEAGDWARAVYANEDALGHYRRALDLLDAIPDAEPERLRVRESVADLLGPTGRRAEALTGYDALLASYAASGDRLAQARLYRKIAYLHWDAGERQKAVESCRAGLALIEAGPPHIEVAHHYEELGRIAFRNGTFAEAGRWAERALAYVEELVGRAVPPGGGAPDPEWRRQVAQVVSRANNTLGVALARQRRIADALSCVERSVSVAEDHGLLDAALRGYSNLGVLYSTLEPERAIDVCRKGLEVARRVGDLRYEARLYANLAVAYCSFTNQCTAEGLAAAERALDLDRRLDLRDHLAVSLTVLAQIHQCHGSPREALRYYDEALKIASEAGEAQLLFPCYDGLAVLYLDSDDEERAEEFFRKAGSVCETAGLDPNALIVLPFLE